MDDGHPLGKRCELAVDPQLLDRAILEMEPTGFPSFEPSALSIFPLCAAAFLSAFVGKSGPFTASPPLVAYRSKTQCL